MRRDPNLARHAAGKARDGPTPRPEVERGGESTGRETTSQATPAALPVRRSGADRCRALHPFAPDNRTPPISHHLLNTARR